MSPALRSKSEYNSLAWLDSFKLTVVWFDCLLDFFSGRAFLVPRASWYFGFSAPTICLARASLLLPLAVSPRQCVSYSNNLKMHQEVEVKSIVKYAIVTKGNILHKNVYRGLIVDLTYDFDTDNFVDFNFLWCWVTRMIKILPVLRAVLGLWQL